VAGGVRFDSRIDEVTFETCPLFATRGKGVISGLVNGVLAGTRCLRDLQPLETLTGELQQRGFFRGRFIQMKPIRLSFRNGFGGVWRFGRG
jgi:hypothetical protein